MYFKLIERLEAVRNDKEVNQSQFAKILDIIPASYSDIKFGRIGISKNILWELENELNLSINWLFTGTGEMGLTNYTCEIPK